MSFIADKVAKHPKLAKLVLALAVAGTTLSGLPSRADAGGIEDVPIFGEIYRGNRVRRARERAQEAGYEAQEAGHNARKARFEADERRYKAQMGGGNGAPVDPAAARKEELARAEHRRKMLKLEGQIAEAEIEAKAIQEGLNGMQGGGAARLDDSGVPAPSSDRGLYTDRVNRQRGAPPSNSPAEVEYGESQHPGPGNPFVKTYEAPRGTTDSSGWADALEKAVNQRRDELGRGGGRGK